ncbi:MAG: hypothetical protein GW893_04755 [Armatimonadetes bacterium]|nr:hypothetical protein [Armatimonadota bacterium]PIU64122.1 MAG: hypothetical protein COS85_13710 [Armatimonadetes bacterium CG07_land_8_20_14_0_80_59_28]PIX40966.1 MAG: hypothetical protein COZ56_13250 [Armatimonadetes bacterium CG_4_8_14_3_um_filter_58_9]PJB73450.1 MAG: hypothetical protein CO095_05780 [Armatimonadetes bacterium CG_4_9_14_3_um_filter_58_7]
MKFAVLVVFCASALSCAWSQTQPPGPPPPPVFGPEVDSITPGSAPNSGVVNVTGLAGKGFVNGASVRLRRSGQSDIVATNVVVVSDLKITGALDLKGKAAGKWTVRVTNPDTNYGELVDGFTVTEATLHDLALVLFSASPNPVSRGTRLTFSGKIKNAGSVSESKATFRIAYNGQTIVGPLVLPTIAAGQELSGSVKFKVPTSVAQGDYMVTGEVSAVSGETDAANNRQTINITVK